MKRDWYEYEQEEEYRKIFFKAHRNHLSLDLKEQTTLEFRQGEPPKIVPKPSHLLIIDDAQGTGLYSNVRRDFLSHIIIKHRHIPITVTLLAQSWTGIPRVIRLNTTQFAVFKTGDKTQLKQMYDTFANNVEFDKFERM